ncbi:MAG: penicillin-binding protein 2, partial [Methylophilaceae bacterium]
MRSRGPIRSKVQEAVKLPAWRRHVLLFLLLAGMILLIGRALYLQSYNRSFYQKQGEARYTRSLTLFAHRGMIKDRNGEPLAISTPVESIWANPADANMNEQQKIKLAERLKIDVAEINRKLSNQDREFVFLKRRISPELANDVMALGIPGIYSQREYRRYYPEGEVTAHLVGFTGVDEKGQEGFELKYQNWLAGKSGSRHVLRDRAGHIVEDLEAAKMPQNGKDL